MPVPYNDKAVAFSPALPPLRLLLYPAAQRQSAPFYLPQAFFLTLSPLSSNKAPPLGLTAAQKLHAASA